VVRRARAILRDDLPSVVGGGTTAVVDCSSEKDQVYIVLPDLVFVLVLLVAENCFEVSLANGVDSY
jgi:hypothetical protein